MVVERRMGLTVFCVQLNDGRVEVAFDLGGEFPQTGEFGEEGAGDVSVRGDEEGVDGLEKCGCKK